MHRLTASPERLFILKDALHKGVQLRAVLQPHAPQALQQALEVRLPRVLLAADERRHCLARLLRLQHLASRQGP